MNNIELYHFPRKYGKTHILVNEMYDYIYKTNAKRILIYSNSNEQVQYISDVITCNLDYQYQNIKRFKSKTNNKFIYFNKNKSIKYVIIVGTYKYFDSIQRKSDINAGLVVFDELLYENNSRRMENILNKYPNAIFKAYYTSKIGPFNKTIFSLSLRDKSNDMTIEKLKRKYNYEYLYNEFYKIQGSIYDSDKIKYSIKEKITLNNFEKFVDKININNKSDIDSLNRIFSSEKSFAEVNYFGMLFTNNFRKNKIIELYNKFKNKIK